MSRPVIVVVGAGPGVSGSVARRFADEGYDVALLGADQQVLDDLVPGDVVLWPNLTGGEVIDLLGRLRGGLEIMVGLVNADQVHGMTGLWGPLGRAFEHYSDLQYGADVIAAGDI